MQIPALIQAISQLGHTDYKDYLRILSALVAEFGAEMALHILTESGIVALDKKRGDTERRLRKPLRNITFGTLIHLLRQHNIDTRELTSGKREEYTPFTPPRRPTQNLTSRSEPIIVSFADCYHEECASIYQYDGGLTRPQAEQRVIDEFPDAVYERCYRVGVSEWAMNKTLLTEGNHDGQKWANFLKTFVHQNLTLSQLIEVVRCGYCFIPCVITGKKTQENFYGADLIAVDVDGTMTLESALQHRLTQNCLFLYTTASHTPESHRFRIVFPMAGFERNAAYYHAALEELICEYDGDRSGTDVVKLYFGNNAAHVWTPQQRWIC